MIETHSSSGELLRKFAEITAGKKPARGCSLVRILPRIGRTEVGPIPGKRSATANSYPTRRELGSRNYDERAAGGWSPLRPPDAALEPENEGVHFRRTQRHPHYRSPENPQDVPRSEPLRERTLRTRQKRSFCGHQTAGAGSGCRRGQALRRVFREPPLAGRNADELGDP